MAGALLNWGNVGNGTNRSTMMIGQDDYVNQAANRARDQYDRGLESTERRLLSMGVNPSSGAFSSMLNDAQYDRTASMNATGNDAFYSWLTAAQNQFNRDRAYNLQQQDRQDANSRYWNEFNWKQKKYNDSWDYRGNNASEQIKWMEENGKWTQQPDGKWVWQQNQTQQNRTPFNWKTNRIAKTELGSPAWFSSLYGNN